MLKAIRNFVLGTLFSVLLIGGTLYLVLRAFSAFVNTGVVV